MLGRLLDYLHFNSQPHEEADAYASYEQLIGGVHFNSQPHEEADFIFVSWKYPKSISTRSLTRRLTHLICLGKGELEFQLAASRGG